MNDKHNFLFMGELFVSKYFESPKHGVTLSLTDNIFSYDSVLSSIHEQVGFCWECILCDSWCHSQVI